MYGTEQVFLADVGTPLMWASMLYLVIGNLLIGIGEGLLIWKFFKTKKVISVLVMIPANYFSAWVGGYALAELTEKHISPDLHFALLFVVGIIFASYLLSILLEWPFVMILFLGQDKWFRRSFLASALAQTGSYLVITPFFFLASSISMLTETSIDSDLGKWVDPHALVYFISSSDDQVYRCDLQGKDLELVSNRTFSGRKDTLFIEHSPGQKWDLYGIHFHSEIDQIGERFLIQPTFAKIAAVTNLQGYDGPLSRDWENFGPATDLREKNDQAWSVTSGFWPVEGLELSNGRTGERRRFSLEAPFLRWPVRAASVIPHGQVIFQLGDDQIAVLDIQTSKLGIVTKGRSPVVVLVPDE